jgi:hypothetical protein
MQIASENEEEEMIPKKYYVELFKQYIDLSVDVRVNYFKGLLTGLGFGILLTILFFTIYG